MAAAQIAVSRLAVRHRLERPLLQTSPAPPPAPGRNAAAACAAERFFRLPQTNSEPVTAQLETVHREGGSGGAPGAMLSAGNLNTAALTLFMALHLSVKPQLPWLILDDPVQSMDEVHIAQFAALLRTLSKEHRRQIVDLDKPLPDEWIGKVGFNFELFPGILYEID